MSSVRTTFEADRQLNAVSVSHHGHGDRTFVVPEEVPVELRVNGLPFVVMMVTPRDIRDFATGFCVSEGLAAGASAVLSIQIDDAPLGIVASVRIARDGLIKRARQRGIEGRSGCGVCGVKTLTDASSDPPPVPFAKAPRYAAVQRAYHELGRLQPLNAATRAVHAAAWCDDQGNVVALREDVGRHNALDKLIGWRARNALTDSGFCVITSRCSFEMVTKAAHAGVSSLVAVSSPTGLAVDIAKKVGMTFIARARADGFLTFATTKQAEG